MDSPRGRIYLMKRAAEGQADITPNWVQHFDTCLGCMSCMTACPSGVDYGKLIEATRAQIERHHSRSLGERLHRWTIFNIFPRPGRLARLRGLLLFYQRSGFQSLVRGSGLVNLLPPRLRALDELMPTITQTEPVPRLTLAQEPKRLRVGMLLGCVQRELL